MSGWYFAEYKISFFKIADKIKWFEYFILLILILISNICFHEEIKFNGISTIISCLFFLKLSGKIIKNEKLFGVTSYFSGFSFFLYAIHTPFLGTSLNKISFKIIPLHGIWCLVQFIVPCIICIVVGTVLGIFLKKICMTLFMAFNGGRK